jgi:diadenosine tetraphosphate (Ap4A) HIT family hydrolase
VFCDIVAGRSPASIVHDDADVIAFLDLYPIQEGHTLVIPRTHVVDAASCPPSLAGHLFAVASDLGQRLVRAVGAEGFNVWTANGKAAGQEVFHLHLHVLPRVSDDAFGLRFPQSYPQQATRTALDALASRLTRRP